MAQIELSSDRRRSDIINKLAMGVPITEHVPLYQRSVDTTSPNSLIAAHCALMHNAGMSFGCRLRDAIRAAGFKSARRFALDGLGWDEATGPQRLQNYLGGRIPDRDTLKLIAGKLGTTPGELLNEGADEALRDILLPLLQLGDIPPDKADTIASAFLEAKRLIEVLPDEGPMQTRARIAAHAAWQTQHYPTPGT
jgi:transcriptional regulator with XRE-family HTH domain